MDIISASHQQMINDLSKLMITPNVKANTYTEDEESRYTLFIKDVKRGKDAEVQLPIDFIVRDDLFNLIRSQNVFVSSSVKFTATVTTKRPSIESINKCDVRYVGNELQYCFLDNHPGIINVNRLSDIPLDYEGLMAVPATILEYKNLIRFNIHRIIYDPIYNGKRIYARVVISNKVINIE